MSKVRVAVVGVGHLGRLHAQKIQHIDAAELVSLVDTSPERRAQMREEFGLEVGADFTKLDGVDAVIIATPTSEHLAVASHFIARGVHVFIEKPLVKTVAEGEQLRRLAQAAPRVVIQVGHIERFNPTIVAIERFSDPPWYVVGERLGPFKERSVDVDVIDDLMIHDLELCARWIDSPLKEVRAVGVSILTGLIDMANARLEFENGAVATLTASRASLESSRKLRLFTKSRYLSLDLEKKEVKSVHRKPPPPGEKWPEIEMERVDVEVADALLAEDRAFVAACLGKEGPKVGIEDGLRAVSMAALIKQELRSPGLDLAPM